MRYLHSIPQERPTLKEFHFNATLSSLEALSGAIERMSVAYQNITTQVNVVAERFIELRATGFR